MYQYRCANGLGGALSFHVPAHQCILSRYPMPIDAFLREISLVPSPTGFLWHKTTASNIIYKYHKYTGLGRHGERMYKNV